MILINTLSFNSLVGTPVRGENKIARRRFKSSEKIIVNTRPTNNFQLREALSFFISNSVNSANNASFDCFL